MKAIPGRFSRHFCKKVLPKLGQKANSSFLNAGHPDSTPSTPSGSILVSATRTTANEGLEKSVFQQLVAGPPNLQPDATSFRSPGQPETTRAMAPGVMATQ